MNLNNTLNVGYLVLPPYIYPCIKSWPHNCKTPGKEFNLIDLKI